MEVEDLDILSPRDEEARGPALRKHSDPKDDESPMRFVPTDLCEDLVCCTICYEPFTGNRIPKALPCLHTFCAECLGHTIDCYRKMVMKKRRKSEPSVERFPCPVCKESTRIPDGGHLNFKDDFRIRRISEVLGQNRNRFASKILFDGNEQSFSPDGEVDILEKKCDVCKFFHKESEAPLYCVECTKLLCHSCSEKHLKTPIAHGHKVVPSNEGAYAKTTCRQHNTEILKYFCHTCKVAICLACTFTDSHQDHDIVDLANEAQNMKGSLEDIVSLCVNHVPNIKSKIIELDSLEQALIDKQKLASKAILSKTLQEISRIRAEQTKMEDDLGEVCKEKYEFLGESRRLLHDRLCEINDYCDFTKTIVQRGQDPQIVGAFSDIKNKLSSMIENALPDMPEGASFVKLGKYDDLINKVDLDVHKSQSGMLILDEMKSLVNHMRTLKVKESGSKTELLKKIGRRGSKDGEFNFPSGVAVLANGDIVVADLHNNRIQIFDKTGGFKRKFGYDGFKPCGVAVTKDGYLAVTDCKIHVNCIKIFKLDGTLVATYGKGEFDYPFAVAIDSKGNYIVSDPAINKITMLDSRGRLFRRFRTKTKFAFYVAINNKDEILVSDWYNHCVKVFDYRGNVIRKIGLRGLEEGQMMIPLGLCTDSHANVIVLDCKCQRISVFSPDGSFLRNLIDKGDGIEHCRAIALSSGGQLIITHGDNKRDVSNEIRIYQF